MVMQVYSYGPASVPAYMLESMKKYGIVMVDTFFFAKDKSEPIFMFIYRAHERIKPDPDRSKLKEPSYYEGHEPVPSVTHIKCQVLWDWNIVEIVDQWYKEGELRKPMFRTRTHVPWCGKPEKDSVPMGNPKKLKLMHDADDDDDEGNKKGLEKEELGMKINK